MSNKNNSSTGLGLLGVLQVIFIVLKLVGAINWTWVQVFIPTFINIGLIIIVLFVAVILAVHKNRR